MCRHKKEGLSLRVTNLEKIIIVLFNNYIVIVSFFRLWHLHAENIQQASGGFCYNCSREKWDGCSQGYRVVVCSSKFHRLVHVATVSSSNPFFRAKPALPPNYSTDPYEVWLFV